MSFSTAAATIVACLILATPTTVSGELAEERAGDFYAVILKSGDFPTDPALVLLHGLDPSSPQFQELTERLSETFQLVFPHQLNGERIIETSTNESALAFLNLTTTINTLASRPGFGSITVFIDGFETPLGLRLATDEEDQIAFEAHKRVHLKFQVLEKFLDPEVGQPAFQ